MKLVCAVVSAPTNGTHMSEQLLQSCHTVSFLGIADGVHARECACPSQDGGV